MNRDSTNVVGGLGRLHPLTFHRVVQLPMMTGCFRGRSTVQLGSKVAKQIKKDHGINVGHTTSGRSLGSHNVTNMTNPGVAPGRAKFGTDLNNRRVVSMPNKGFGRKIRDRVVWSSFIMVGHAIGSGVSLTARKVKELGGYATSKMKEGCQKAKDYVFNNKQQLAKMAFVSIFSYCIEDMIMIAAVTSGAVIPLVHVRVFAYVATEILWFVLQGRAVPPKEVDRIAVGVIQSPVFGLVMDQLMGPFVRNVSAAIILQPLKGMSVGDITPRNIFSYVGYALKHGIDFGIEKAKVFGAKYIVKQAVQRSVEEAKRRSPTVSPKLDRKLKE